IPNGPLKNLTDYVERAGCLVFHCDFSQEGVSGVTIKVPGLNPCIFIDKNMPSDRQRFTLAHELGHAIMHKLPSENMEDEANRFASALLMPSKDIRPYLTGKITLEKLATLKLVWKVSMNALLKTAEREGLLTPSQKKYLWIQMTKNGYRTKEPVELDFPKEKAVTIDQIFEYYREDLGYSIDELSNLLQTPKEDIDSLYSLNIVKKKPNIRILE
ncbi:ImmA/IrrE family metallo-endopeptidase, partial [Acinetobacter baumannii]